MEPITLVKLKMRMIYKTILVFIAFLIVATSTVGVIYMFYDKVIDSDGDIEVNGALSINYVNGKKFDIDLGNKKVIDFSVSNGSDSVTYYNIGFMQIRGNGTYRLLDKDKVVMEGNLKSIDEITTDYISIDAKETKIYTLELENTGDINLKGLLNIRSQNGKLKTFSDLILEQTKPSNDAVSKVGNEIATLNEGLIKSSDDIGVSYYFRGDIDNNYVSFAGLLWRIVRINGDGTVRIVLDNITETVANYYTDTNKNFEFKESKINEFLDNWFQENLKNYTNYIATSKFCSDINHDGANNYLANTRILTNEIPTLNCLGTSVSSNIGLLTIDEVILAGASPTSINQNYYLYNSNITNSWYTMSAASGNEESINMFMIDSTGKVDTTIKGNLYRGVRPVINLIKNIDMTGTGTELDPYHLTVE